MDHQYIPEKTEGVLRITESPKGEYLLPDTFSARLLVFHEGGPRSYNMAQEDTKDMKTKSLQVDVVKPAEDLMRGSDDHPGRGAKDLKEDSCRKQGRVSSRSYKLLR